MNQPEPDEGTDTVRMPRRDLRLVRDLLIGMLAGIVVLAGAFIVRLRDSDDVQEANRVRDARLASVVDSLREEQGRLDELISAEAHEEEREAAAGCVNSHVRYLQLFELLHIIAPEDEAAIRERYGPPTCNRAEAQAILDADPDEPLPADPGR